MWNKKTIFDLLKCLCLITFFLFFSFFPAQAQEKIPSLKIEWKKSRLSVVADGVSLIHVLREVSHHTGMDIRGIEYLQEPVTVSFSGFTISEGLKALMRHVNYAMYKKSISQGEVIPTRVQILGIRKDHSFECIGTEAETNVEDDFLEDNFQGPDTNERLSSIQELSKTNYPYSQDILHSSIHDPDPSIREIAYKLLYEKNNKKTADILFSDARNSDDNIRKTAISVLGELAGPDAVSILRDATEDSNTDIRYMAFLQISQIESQEGISILRSRLTHPDPEIRILAIEAMASKGEEFAIEAARTTYNDNDELVRNRAERLIHEFEARGRR